MSRLLGLAGLAAGLALAAGCGGGPSPVKVSGVVTVGGQPADGVTVSFAPDGTGGRAAGAVTKADGTFELTTIDTGDGALPGSYRVLVTYKAPYEAPEGTSPMKAMMGGQAPPKKAAKSKYTIPAKYGDFAQTPLKQTVPAGGPVKLDIP